MGLGSHKSLEQEQASHKMFGQTQPQGLLGLHTHPGFLQGQEQLQRVSCRSWEQVLVVENHRSFGRRIQTGQEQLERHKSQRHLIADYHLHRSCSGLGSPLDRNYSEQQQQEKSRSCNCLKHQQLGQTGSCSHWLLELGQLRRSC